MIKTIITVLILSSTLLSALEELKLHSQIEYLDFSNSVQKEDGKRYSLGFSGKENNHLFGLQYELTRTHTKQPPLTEDLHVGKFGLQYGYLLNTALSFQGRYIHIEDNLAPTDNGDIYGIGMDYKADKKYLYGVRFYASDYALFDAYQTDLSVTRVMKYQELSIKLTGILKAIWLDEKNSSSFTSNAQDAYLTPGIKAHFVYHDYIGGIGAFFGKRVFAVMDDGKRIQHHAMEFDRTLMLGVGKKFDDVTIMVKYNYMRATELPYQNDDVTVNNTMLSVQYKF